MFFSAELLFKPLDNLTWFWCPKLKRCFYDSSNIVMILSSWSEVFLWYMWSISFNIYEMKLIDGDFPSGTDIIHLEKSSQEISFKNHSFSVVLCQQEQMLSDFWISLLFWFYFTRLWSLLQWSWKMSIITVIEII